MAKKPFVSQFRAVVPSGSTSYTIYGKSLPSNILVCYDRIAAADLSGTPTLVTFGFRRGAEDILLGSKVPSVAGQCVDVKGKLYLPGHYVPYASFTGVTGDNVLVLSLFGYTTESVD